MPERVKVLVVDDSAYMRVVLKDIIEADEGMVVVDTARDGLEAINKTKQIGPDVVLLDIQMPKMDGLATLQRIMKEVPTRVVMLSAMDKVDDQLPLRALEMGAVDFISKPSGPVSIDIVRYSSKIRQILMNAALAKLDALKKARAPLPHKLAAPSVSSELASEWKAIAIAASTGGPRALEVIFSALPRDIPAPVFIVQHLPAEFSASFAKRLDSAKGPRVVVARDNDQIEKGVAYLAPGGKHLKVERERSGFTTVLDDSDPVQFVKPSANVLFESAANCFGENLMVVILTGMGSDGAAGARAVGSAGGRVVVQDEPSSVIFGMARAAIDSKVVHGVVPLEDIPQEIIRFLEED
jgi:two-component system chemotaxis response regulator CheB